MVEFDVKITTKDMYDYNVYHNYRNINGITGILLGIICLFLCLAGVNSNANISYVLMMGFIGLFFTIITPVRIYMRSAQQVMMTPSFKKPLHYAVDQKQIVISQDEVSASYPLEEVWKVVDTGKSVVVYVTRVRAYIFPKRELGDKEQMLKDVLKNSLTKQQYRIKE